MRLPRLALLCPAFLLFPTVYSAFSPTSDSNIAIYWGQGADQRRLVDFCKDTSIDIINLAFVNIFPDQSGSGGWPGTNFGNACGGATYLNNGLETDLQSNCQMIGPDIKTCQQQYNKIILLSIGGAVPGNGFLTNQSSALQFGDFLWGAFGPVMGSWTASNLPRPFGDAVVDGFDFDIESISSDVSQESYGWSAMIGHLKEDLYPLDASKSYYISGAPQCVIPDAHLSNSIATAWYDFLFVQFYNTPYCSARAGIAALDGTPESSGWDISLDAWFDVPSKNPNSKIFIGLPASPAAAGSGSFYLAPSEVALLVNTFRPQHEARFGGVMLWEATYSYDNMINGEPYADAIKNVLGSGSSNQLARASSTVASPTVTATTSSSSTAVQATPPSSFITTTISQPHLTTSSSTTTATAAPTTAGSCSAASLPCSRPGSIICIGDTQFGLCDINYCAIPQPLAAGTHCQGGSIAKRSLRPQRTADFARAALRRRMMRDGASRRVTEDLKVKTKPR